jgi:hypothetical protein
MTFLKENGIIQPVEPPRWSTFPKSGKQRRHYSVEVDLVMIIEGRNLRYQVVYPPEDQAELQGKHQQVQAESRICIAAAFKPGTL